MSCAPYLCRVRHATSNTGHHSNDQPNYVRINHGDGNSITAISQCTRSSSSMCLRPTVVSAAAIQLPYQSPSPPRLSTSVRSMARADC
eukprot:scaffold31391_cov75-Cyclotella_meneghiniana.AAC.11